jgi:hypothetical protein
MGHVYHSGVGKPHTGDAIQRAPRAPDSADIAALADFDALLQEPPIAGPKGWTDDLERAAIARCCIGTPPPIALVSCGVGRTQAFAWLSDEPPEGYKSACLALAERLKRASDWMEANALARINAAAAADPKQWTALAWILERSRGYVVKQNQQDGPSIVVNIGSVNVTSGAPRAQLREAVDEVIDAVPMLTEGRKPDPA